MDKPIRVLQMIGSLNMGGSQAMVINLYKNIDRTKIQFDFIIDHPQETFFKELLLSMGAKIYEMPAFKGWNVSEVKKAWKSFFTEHPEYKILHSHVRSYASLYIPIAKKHGLTTIIHSHSTSNGKGFASLVKRVLQSSLKRKADYLFACSEESGRWLYGDKAIHAPNYRMIPNAVDTEKFAFSEATRAEMRQALGIADDTVVYGHVGRLHPAKNHPFLLDTFYKIHQRQENSLLFIVGDGELRAEIEEKISTLGIADSVRMLGSRGDVAQLMQAMDVFLFPSRWEGLPVTVVEAQASGLPCYLSDTITRDVDTSPLVTYLPITSGADIWADTVLGSPNKRQNVTESIKSCGFDIQESAKNLSDFYLGVLSCQNT